MKKTLFSLTVLLCSLCFYRVAADVQPPTTPVTPAVIVPKPIPQYTISISSPQPEETFQNSAQSITVAVSVTPELQADDTVVVYVDGSPAGDPVHSTSIALPWLERGPHTIQAKIIQPKGQGAESATITIFQQRASKLLNN